MSAATALLAKARTHGAALRLDGEGKLRAHPATSPDLVAELRAHKTELAALLRGDACRWCGEPMDWPRPVGIIEGSGTALHHACYELAEVARIEAVMRSPETLNDPAEMTARGVPLP